MKKHNMVTQHHPPNLSSKQTHGARQTGYLPLSLTGLPPYQHHINISIAITQALWSLVRRVDINSQQSWNKPLRLDGKQQSYHMNVLSYNKEKRYHITQLLCNMPMATYYYEEGDGWGSLSFNVTTSESMDEELGDMVYRNSRTAKEREAAELALCEKKEEAAAILDNSSSDSSRSSIDANSTVVEGISQFAKADNKVVNGGVCMDESCPDAALPCRISDVIAGEEVCCEIGCPRKKYNKRKRELFLEEAKQISKRRQREIKNMLDKAFNLLVQKHDDERNNKIHDNDRNYQENDKNEDIDSFSLDGIQDNGLNEETGNDDNQEAMKKDMGAYPAGSRNPCANSRPNHGLDSEDQFCQTARISSPYEKGMKKLEETSLLSTSEGESPELKYKSSIYARQLFPPNSTSSTKSCEEVAQRGDENEKRWTFEEDRKVTRKTGRRERWLYNLNPDVIHTNLSDEKVMEGVDSTSKKICSHDGCTKRVQSKKSRVCIDHRRHAIPVPVVSWERNESPDGMPQHVEHDKADSGARLAHIPGSVYVRKVVPTDGINHQHYQGRHVYHHQTQPVYDPPPYYMYPPPPPSQAYYYPRPPPPPSYYDSLPRSISYHPAPRIDPVVQICTLASHIHQIAKSGEVRKLQRMSEVTDEEIS